MKAVFVGTMSLAAAVAIAAVIVSVGSREAAAKPEFASQTGKPCGFCHVKPSGGLPLNAQGEKFKKNGFKM
jgi:hypothetical protein